MHALHLLPHLSSPSLENPSSTAVTTLSVVHLWSFSSRYQSPLSSFVTVKLNPIVSCSTLQASSKSKLFQAVLPRCMCHPSLSITTNSVNPSTAHQIVFTRLCSTVTSLLCPSCTHKLSRALFLYLSRMCKLNRAKSFREPRASRSFELDPISPTPSRTYRLKPDSSRSLLSRAANIILHFSTNFEQLLVSFGEYLIGF